VGILDKLGRAALDAAARYVDTRERKVEAARPKPASAPEPSPEPARASNELRDPNELGDETIPVQVFGRMSCPWTQRALRLLDDRGIENVYTELAQPGGFSLVPKLVAATGQRTVPYVYLRGEFVGGYDALDEIDRLGQLDEMIKSKAERAASGNRGRIRIQVAPRTR
jgi:glutaredoxin 3